VNSASGPGSGSGSGLSSALGSGSGSGSVLGSGSGSGMRIRGRGRGKSGMGHHAGSVSGSPYSSTPPRMVPSGSPIGSLEFHMKMPPGPRMPDGTRGFTFGRGKKMNDMNLMVA
jgi:hypothetical protein